MQLPKGTSGGNAPDVEAGLAVVRMDDIVQRSHPDWAGPTQYGNDDGERFHLLATLLDKDGAVVYSDGEPIELEAMTRNSSKHEKANFRAHMEGILTKGELAAWLVDEPLPEDPAYGPLQGRRVNVKISHSAKSGWPFIEDFISPIKVGK